MLALGDTDGLIDGLREGEILALGDTLGLIDGEIDGDIDGEIVTSAKLLKSTSGEPVSSMKT